MYLVLYFNEKELEYMTHETNFQTNLTTGSTILIRL